MGGYFFKMKKICFILLFLVIVSSCTTKEETEDYNMTSIEDLDEKNDIIEKAQAAVEEIQSMKTITILTQQFTGESINEETTIQVDNNLLFDPLSSSVHVLMTTLGQNVEFSMYSNEDATYFTENPNTENEVWQRLPETEHEEIIADYKRTTSFINYDLLLEHIDELVVNDVDDDIEYYELILNGDSNIYHQLLTQDHLVDMAEEQASVDTFSFSIKLEKDTGHLINFDTTMYGTVDFEGEVISLFETMTLYVEGINIFEDEYSLVPVGVEQYIENNE
ncbi:hypothetical protein AJ85_06940 [Alkalihalobacillus alcalophilus ATCC 27647 = CGMCC 1.3604]|uniref:Uncharacterized protein n=2 Tax=Alkalihalobacillus alcalophilus TaxID=1445 RepID=A0A094YQ69_ALKAL|nr:hypothetical protein BALCAV_0221305 [Alkalihalobacillus alcalophilus ATCC 27647 = CGMCC 1.3604]THG91102.1 hypothetical protein AJ85_06940 [Alkalihalobacillus alcalophilus ATCC 27647 = CGMCC 1.3604]